MLRFPPLLRCALAGVALAIAPALAAQTPAATDDPRGWKWNDPNGSRPAGVVHHVLRSHALGLDVGYNVYLPASYAQGGRFPVLYFLHGYGGDENSDAGFIARVDSAVARGLLPPVIVVFPNGARSWYRDRPETGVLGETLLVRELVPTVDSLFRTVRGPKGRAVVGFSMGGAGALRLALAHPDLFAAAGSWGGAFGRERGDDLFTVATANRSRLRRLPTRLMVVNGDGDSLERNRELVTHLTSLGIRNELVVLPGVGHDLGAYHRQTSARVLAFVGRHLRRS